MRLSPAVADAGAIGDSASAASSVSSESSAHLRRAGLISMPRMSSTSWLVSAATSSSGLPLISSVSSWRDGLADRAAAAGERDVRDLAVARCPASA